MKFNCNKLLSSNEQEGYIARAVKAQDWQECFAWLPVLVGDNECRWLERVERRCAGGRPWVDWDNDIKRWSQEDPFTSRLFWSTRPVIEYRAKEKA
jgi:hypothetical protein